MNKRIVGQIRSIPDNVEESRTITFTASTPAKDRHGTILNIEGWTIEKFNQNPIIGYQHNVYGDDWFNKPDPDSVIGKGRAYVEGNSLMVDVTFEPKEINEQAEKIFRKVLFGTLKAVSVGFLPTDSPVGRWGEGEEARDGKNPTFYYGKRDLLEVSLVNIPSNAEALMRKFEDELIKDTEPIPTSVPDCKVNNVKQLKLGKMETKKVLPGTLKAAYEERNKLNADLMAWRERVTSGEETMDNEDMDKLDRMLADRIVIDDHIERLRKLESIQIEKAASVIDEKMQEEKKPELDVNKTFEKFLRYGERNMTPDEVQLISSQKRAVTDPQSTTTTGGGYLIPYGFQAQLEKAMLPYASLFEAGTIQPTGEGNTMYWPTVNDTSIKGHLLSEGSQDTVYNVTFGQVTFYAYMFTSYIVKVPLQLLQDSAIPVEPMLADLLGERLGRILSDYFTTGTGSSQPQGIVYGATDASVTCSASAITRDAILDLKHSVNAMYRSAPGAAFMFNDSTFKAIAKLTFGTSDDRPLWQASIASGQPDTIEGKRFYINDSMDDIGASKEPMIFGDLKKFMIRKVLGTILFVYREKYMDYLQIGFQAYNRWDSRILDAGTHPIKKLVQAAT